MNDAASATSPDGAATIAARMDRLPITPLHRRVTAVIGLGLFFDLYEVFLAGTLSATLKHKFNLDGTGLTLLLSSAFLGMFLGAIVIGRISDRLGRRPAFLLSMSVYSVFTFAAAFSPNPATLVALRFLAGTGIGAEPPVSDTYLGDMLPPRYRGRFTAWAYTLSFLAVPAAGFLGFYLVPRAPFGFDGWRWMFLFGALGAVIMFFARRGLPESPRWLASVGRHDEADAIVTGMEDAARERGLPLPPPVATASAADDERVGLRDLLRPALRGRTVMMVVMQFFQTWGYYGFGTLVPIVLVGKGYDVVTSLGFLGVTYLGYPVGSLISLPIIDRVERKYLIVASVTLMAVFGVAFGFADGTAMILVLGFAYTAVSNIFSNAYHVYQAEVFPTRVRGTASSWAYSLSRLSSALMPFILVPVLHHGGSGALFAVVAAAMAMVALSVGLLGPRTTGRALGEVNAG
ncbi:MFS transporter [Gordonia sp. X0973]|uniref:MFS transporter n=1 Tax=Gordonia sp. X0973 TaxID=2742602 RepID=UPI000F5240B6|nr:MFS transporter [Gordonia sp. X0973]QKT08619.1 MFS transporter [Gordonia sp. X0973]